MSTTHTRVFSLVLLAAGAAAAGGCHFYSAPKLEVVDMGLAGETEEGRVLEFVVRAANSNSEPLPLEDVYYRLTLDGKQVFTGRRSAEATVPAKGEQTFRVLVPLSEAEIGGREAAPYSLSGRAVYRKPGPISELLYENEVWRSAAWFGESGVLRFDGERAGPD